jgi:hypothetical protein
MKNPTINRWERRETFESIVVYVDVIREGSMGIGPVNRVAIGTNGTPGLEELGVTYGQLVMAVRSLNQSDRLGGRRELRLRRQGNERVLVELLDRETGEILGELPPGDVVQMAAQLHHGEAQEE